MCRTQQTLQTSNATFGHAEGLFGHFVVCSPPRQVSNCYHVKMLRWYKCCVYCESFVTCTTVNQCKQWCSKCVSCILSQNQMLCQCLVNRTQANPHLCRQQKFLIQRHSKLFDAFNLGQVWNRQNPVWIFHLKCRIEIDPTINYAWIPHDFFTTCQSRCHHSIMNFILNANLNFPSKRLHSILNSKFEISI